MNDRPSAWLAGAGVGLFLVAACGVVVTLGGWAAPWQLYAALGGLGLGLTVATDFGLNVLDWWRAATVAVRLDQARAWHQELANQARELELQAATGDPPAAPDPEPVRRAAWDAANITLFVGGDKAGGYSQAKMQGMISSDPWQAWSDYYAASPDGDPVLQRVPGKVGTKLAYRWPLTRVLFAITRGELPTPPGPPPSVREFTPERRAAEKSESASEVVIENVGKG